MTPAALGLAGAPHKESGGFRRAAEHSDRESLAGPVAGGGHGFDSPCTVDYPGEVLGTESRPDLTVSGRPRRGS